MGFCIIFWISTQTSTREFVAIFWKRRKKRKLLLEFVHGMAASTSTIKQYHYHRRHHHHHHQKPYVYIYIYIHTQLIAVTTGNINTTTTTYHLHLLVKVVKPVPEKTRKAKKAKNPNFPFSSLISSNPKSVLVLSLNSKRLITHENIIMALFGMAWLLKMRADIKTSGNRVCQCHV
jgi:hypothetical protein